MRTIETERVSSAGLADRLPGRARRPRGHEYSSLGGHGFGRRSRRRNCCAACAISSSQCHRQRLRADRGHLLVTAAARRSMIEHIVTTVAGRPRRGKYGSSTITVTSPGRNARRYPLSTATASWPGTGRTWRRPRRSSTPSAHSSARSSPRGTPTATSRTRIQEDMVCGRLRRHPAEVERFLGSIGRRRYRRGRGRRCTARRGAGRLRRARFRSGPDRAGQSRRPRRIANFELPRRAFLTKLPATPHEVGGRAASTPPGLMM